MLAKLGLTTLAGSKHRKEMSSHATDLVVHAKPSSSSSSSSSNAVGKNNAIVFGRVTHLGSYLSSLCLPNVRTRQLKNELMPSTVAIRSIISYRSVCWPLYHCIVRGGSPLLYPSHTLLAVTAIRVHIKCTITARIQSRPKSGHLKTTVGLLVFRLLGHS